MLREAGLPAEMKGRRVREGGSNSVVESQPSKLLVAGSIPVSRSSSCRQADEPAAVGSVGSGVSNGIVVRRQPREVDVLEDEPM